MKHLIYKIGREREVVLEVSDYKESIFQNQYEQAVKLIDGYVNATTDETLKCIAFCGNRGDGKTSCMSSVLKIITSFNDSNTKANHFVKDKAERLLNKKISVIDLIDPSFFWD